MFYNTPSHYTMTPGGMTITLNALGTDTEGRNYTQCNVVRGARLYVYIDDETNHIALYETRGKADENGNVHKYALGFMIECYPTHFANNDPRYVYAAIPKKYGADTPAIIVFPDRKLDVLGRVETGEGTSAEYGNPDYYYIHLGGIITSASQGARAWQQPIDQGAIFGYIIGDDAANMSFFGNQLFLNDQLIAMFDDLNYFEIVREPIYVVDENGDIVVDPVTGEPIIEQEQETDEDGNLIFIDEWGNKTTDDTGTPSMIDKYSPNEGVKLKDTFDYIRAKVVDADKFSFRNGDKYFLDIQRSTDEEKNFLDDEILPTFGYVEKTQLSSQEDDEAQGTITFHKGLLSGDETYSTSFIPGPFGAGWKLWLNGHGEMDSLSLRKFLEVPELRFNRVSVHTGVDWQTFGGGIIEEVTQLSATTGIIKLKLEDGEYGAIEIDDKCQGIYHNVDGDNSTEERDDHHGNFEFKGFQTIYFRVTAFCDADGNTSKPDSRHQYFRYELRPASADWQGFSAGKYFHPQPGMHFASYSNKTHADRQASIYSTTRYTVFLTNMTEWTYDGNNIALVFGWLEGFRIPCGKDEHGNIIYKDLHGMGIGTGKIFMWGQIEQFDRPKFLISQQLHLMATDDDIETVLSHDEINEETGQPTENHWKFYYHWYDSQELMEESGRYLYQYWTYTYDDGSTEDTDPFIFGSMADPQRRYYLEPSVSSVVIDEMHHYSEESLSCRQMVQDGQAVPVETTDLIITMSVDGGDEQPYSIITLADTQPLSAVKYYLRDKDKNLYDTKSVAILADGTSSARIIFSKDLVPLECTHDGWGDNITSESGGFYYLANDYLVKNNFYVLAGTEQRAVKEGSVTVVFDPEQPLEGEEASIRDIHINSSYVSFSLLKDKFRTDRNTTVTVTLRYDDGSTLGAELTGSFQITYNRAGQDGLDAIGGKGATLFPVEWEKVKNTDFEFQSGQEGDKFINMVLCNDLWYECIENVTTAVLRATGLTPATDTTHFREANNFEAVATRLLYAKFGYIENAGVHFLQAGDADGIINCYIDGNTGKLTARGVEILGKIIAESGNIGGFDISDKLLVNSNYDAGISIETLNKTQTVNIGQSANTGKVMCSMSASSVLGGMTNRQMYNNFITDSDILSMTSINSVLHLWADNGTINNAIQGRGNGLLDGVMCGYRMASVQLPAQFGRGLLYLEEGNTVVISGSADEGKTDFLLPRITNVWSNLQTAASTFAIPYTVVNLCEKGSRPIYLTSSISIGIQLQVDYPQLLDNDMNVVDRVKMSPGDVYRVLLIYDGTHYYAVRDTHSS